MCEIAVLIAELIESHLKHSSSLIQLKTGHLFLQLFGSWTETELVEAQESPKSKEYLVKDIDSKVSCRLGLISFTQTVKIHWEFC